MTVEPPTTAELQTAAVKGSLWTSFQASVSLPLTVATNIAVARILGPVQFGYLATLIAAYSLASVVANLGVSDATIQWGARAFARGERADLEQLVRRCAGYHILVETPVLVAITAIVLRHVEWQAQLVGCLAAAATMTLGTASVAQTLMSRTAALARVVLIVNVALQASTMGTAALSHSGFVTWTARIAVASTIPTLLFLRLPSDLRRAVVRPLAPRAWPSGFVSYAIKAGLGTLAATIVFSRSEIFILQGDDQHVAAGLYALAFGLAAQITAPVDALLGPLQPAAASLAAVAPDRLAEAVLRGLRFTAVATGGIAAFVVAPLSALVVPIYGTHYAAVADLLPPLALLSCIQSLNHPVTAFLYGMKRVGAMLIVNMVAFAVDMAIAAATVGSIHVWGAVVANASGQCLALGGAVAVLRRDITLDARETWRALRPFLAGAASAAAGWEATRIGSYSAVATAALSLAVGGMLFLALQALGGPTLSRRDRDVLLGGIPAAARAPLARTLSTLRFAA